MRIETIDELAGVLAQSQLTSLELESEQWCITLERSAPGVRPSTVAPPAAASAPAAMVDSRPPAEAAVVVEAAVVGVFHEAPKHVAVGQIVRAADLLGTIDALTIRNDVRAGSDGEVVSVHVEDGQPVEYGQPLFAVRLQGEG